MQRAVKVAYWAIPSLFCLFVYWYGFRSWFKQDDFAWLGLHLHVHDLRSLVWALFSPMAQGSIRPLSERLFFMSLGSTFGMDALPFRLVIFATVFFDLTMLCALANRLAGSRIAGFAAAMLWAGNAALAVPLSWVSAYNEVMCAGFLLSATYLFVRYTETGRRRYYWWQWLVFVAGFGALEINVVYPAVAALYALCCARKYFKATLPMFAVSAAYALAHRVAEPAQANSIYRLYFDSEIFRTLATYVRWVAGGERMAEALGMRLRPFYAAEALVWAGLIAAFVWAVRKRQWIALFFAGWFFGVLLPVLPLKNHVTDYYVLLPSLGLAMLGGWAIAAVWKAPGVAMKAAAVAVALVYLGPAAWAGRKQARYNYESSQQVRDFLERVAYAHKIHPHKLLLIRGVDDQLFWAVFYGNPFRIFGLQQIYITEDSRGAISARPELTDLSAYFLPDATAFNALKQDRAVVYQVAGTQLRNITPAYTEMLAGRADLRLSARVLPGVLAYDNQLGDGWYPIEGNFRWMKKRGVVFLRGPDDAGQALEITGECPELQLEKGPLHITVSVDGRAVGTSEITRANRSFALRYALPRNAIGKARIEVAIEVDRTVSTAVDTRMFGVVINAVALAR